MPFCPNCQVEYRAGYARCSDCDVELVPSLPGAAPSQVDTASVELVELAAFPNASEADMIQELLEDNGIDTVLRGDVDPLGIAEGNAGITLLVNRTDLEEAERIYNGFFAGEVEGGQQPPEEEEEEDSDQASDTAPHGRS
jgi:hypothetical protein